MDAHNGQCEPDVRVAWLSLDDGDNDPSRFVTYVVSAVQTLDGDIRSDALSLLADAPAPPVDVAFTALINDAATARGLLTGDLGSACGKHPWASSQSRPSNAACA